MPDIDTTNKYLVTLAGIGTVQVLRPLLGPIPNEDALNLAAWLVALADPGGERFAKVLDAVRNT